MEFNLITNIEACYVAVPHLLYYSHIPTSFIALMLGGFLYAKNRQSLAVKILLLIGIFFSLWSAFDLILFLGHDSRMIMFFWSFVNLIEISVSFLALYFSYVFFEKKDVPLKYKIFFSSLLILFAVLVPTTQNLTRFEVSSCEAIQGPLVNYFYFLETLSFVWLLIYLFRKIFQLKGKEKAEAIYFSLGVLLFLFSFSGANIIGSITGKWEILQYGLFGMPAFMGFLAYLVVRYEAFHIKLLGAQALIVTLIVLIGSQFSFIRSDTNKILTTITLVLVIGFGWVLIRSVKKEIKRKEELAIANKEIEKRNKKLNKANKEISERKDQLQKMADSLAIANDKLKKLDMAKTEFVSMASHQLRTPPTPIKGYSSMLLEGSYGELNTEQKKAVENIANANNQQIAFVEDLLSVSRIESGSMKFVFAKTQIGDLCTDVINNLTLKAKDKKLYLDYKAPTTPLPEITVDGAKVREVISNLVDNALKYTLRGGVTLSTELCKRKRPDCLSKPHLRITVSDTGIGVPAEEMPYLFHKFSRGKDITRLNTGGTGLGLYVVKMITEANGGKVWIESPGANMGTKFIVELPLEQEKETLERNG